MKFDLLEGIKIRYLFIQMLVLLFLGVIALIFYLIIFHGMSTGSVEIFVLIISILWLLLVLRFLKKHNISIKNFIEKPSNKRYIFEVPLSLLLTYLGGIGLILIITFLVYNINPNILEFANSDVGKIYFNNNLIFIAIVNFLGIVVIGPISEELIFRGVLLSSFYIKYGIKKSIIYSSLIFFIMHISLNPLIFFLGISCCILVYKYKSLIPSIILHITNNLLVFLRDFYSSSNVQNFSNDLKINVSILIIGSILLLIYFFYIYKNSSKLKFFNLSNINNL